MLPLRRSKRSKCIEILAGELEAPRLSLLRVRGSKMDELGAYGPVRSMTVQDAINYLMSEKIDPLEPVFILRGQDILAPGAVFAWAHSAEKHGIGLTKLAGAWESAGKMLAWKHRKLPD